MAGSLIPYTKEVRLRHPDGYLSYVQVTWGFKQRRPYNQNTPVTHATFYGNGTDADSWSWSPGTLFKSQVDAARNQAYDRLVSRLGDSSSFGATFTAERKETWGMVVGLLTTGAKSARLAAHGRFPEALRLLNVPYREVTVHTKSKRKSRRGGKSRNVTLRRTFLALPGGRLVAKTLASSWLLWSYGIKPLMEDLYNGMDVLQRPLPVREKIRGGATRTGATSYRDKYEVSGVTMEFSVRCSCTVSVSNPNLWLANKMGLVNPAQWALEAVPFSFVLDWFSNLSSVVNSMTDFVGLNVEEGVTTIVATSTEYLQRTPAGGGWGWNKKRVVFERVLTIPSPKLHVEYERFSWQRGANAVSLLIGFLPGSLRSLSK